MRFAAICSILFIASSNISWADETDPQSSTTQQASPAPQTSKDHQPKVCSSFNKELNYWGPIGQRLGKAFMNCPDNHVLMSVSPVLKRKYASGASSVGISGTCCPLPAEDILLDEKVSSFTDCPDNFIVTGVFPEKPLPKCEAAREDPLNGALSGLCSLSAYKTKTKLLCTKIDSKRYKLGPVTTGLHKAMSGHLGELFSDDFTSWKQIPVALRYGLGRLTRSLWTESNCVGFPWGSIFVGKDGKYCSEIKFRQLLFQGLPQDPPADTPVKMFPDCLRLDDPLSEFPKCLKLEK